MKSFLNQQIFFSYFRNLFGDLGGKGEKNVKFTYRISFKKAFILLLKNVRDIIFSVTLSQEGGVKGSNSESFFTIDQ